MEHILKWEGVQKKLLMQNEWQANGEKSWGLIKIRQGARENQEAQKIPNFTR